MTLDEAEAATPTSGTKSSKLRVALCGSGRIGRVHAANIAADSRLEFAWVADPLLDSAHELAARYGATATGSMDEVFADRNLDAVVICSPAPTHVKLIQAAAGRGVAVLCEKPIDLDMQRVLDGRAAIEGTNAPVMMGFNRRFDPAFAAVHRRVADGEIGPLEQLSVISRDPSPPPESYIRASGGIFRDMTIHDFDMARFFLPDIVAVTATGSNLFCDYIKDAGDYDSVLVTLRSREGQLVSITNSRHSSYGYDQRMEAFGSTGMLSAANLSPTTVRKYAADGVEQADAYEPFFLERYADAYRLELDHFIECVQAGRQCAPGFNDGAAALVLAEAAVESAAAGKTISIEGVL